MINETECAYCENEALEGSASGLCELCDKEETAYIDRMYKDWLTTKEEGYSEECCTDCSQPHNNAISYKDSGLCVNCYLINKIDMEG